MSSLVPLPDVPVRPPPSRRGRRARALRNGIARLAKAAGVALLVVYFAFCALFLTLRYAVLPNIEHYKGDIEQAASRALGNRVTIGSVRASWRGLRPELSLADVAVRTSDGRRALALPAVSAVVSWWSVPAAGLRLER
ncbi:MAG: YhdP family protein, partial [Burkholderiaceae bacterium]